MNRTLCLSCGHQAVAFDNFMDLSVEIPKKAVRFTGTVSLQDCLDKFVEPEKMIDCGFKCEACLKKVSVEKDLTLFRLPRVLVVHLKRFYHSAMRKDKLNTTVNFQETVDMRRYMPHSGKTHLTLQPTAPNKTPPTPSSASRTTVAVCTAATTSRRSRWMADGTTATTPPYPK